MPPGCMCEFFKNGDYCIGKADSTTVGLTLVFCIVYICVDMGDWFHLRKKRKIFMIKAPSFSSFLVIPPRGL